MLNKKDIEMLTTKESVIEINDFCKLVSFAPFCRVDDNHLNLKVCFNAYKHNSRIPGSVLIAENVDRGIDRDELIYRIRGAVAEYIDSVYLDMEKLVNKGLCGK